jgi:hypothetical protein
MDWLKKIFWHLPDGSEESNQKTHEDSQCPSQHLYWRPPEYKFGINVTPTFLVVSVIHSTLLYSIMYHVHRLWSSEFTRGDIIMA